MRRSLGSRAKSKRTSSGAGSRPAPQAIPNPYASRLSGQDFVESRSVREKIVSRCAGVPVNVLGAPLHLDQQPFIALAWSPASDHDVRGDRQDRSCELAGSRDRSIHGSAAPAYVGKQLRCARRAICRN
jgi:hypothetical protein